MKNLNFYGLDSSNNRQLRMSIDTSGNVGLGITDPTTRLEIVGDLSLNGSIYHNGILFTPSENTSTNIDQTTDISLNNLKVHGDLSANDASFNVIDVSAIFIQGRDLIGEDVPTALDTLKELADALDNSANFAANVTTTLAAIQSDLSTKQDTITTNDLSLGDISGLYTQLNSKQNTIADGDLTIAKTSGLQTALDSKQATITTNDLSLGDISGLYIQLNSKQNTIADGDLTIAKTSGLQSALDAKQATISTNDLSLGDISGLYTQLNSKQNTIADGDLTIAKTNGLQSALDAKQATITTNDLSLGDISGLYAQLDSKQNNIADGDLTIAKTSGLQTALDSKQATITTNDLSLGDISGLYTQLNSKQNTIADGDLTIAKTSGLQSALDAKQANVTESVDVSLNNLKVHGDLSANDASFNVLEAIQVLINGEDLSGTIYTKINTDIYNAISNLVDNAPIALDTLKELADALDNSANFASNVTVRLNAIETDVAGKQNTIADGDLTIAKTNGLQSALDAKQATITTNDLSLGDISGLYTQLASKQDTIADGDLTIAKTSGLQSALDAKQATITTNDLSLGDVSGLYTQLASKQPTIADGDLTIAKTSGLQSALDAKQATISDGDLTIAKTSGLQSTLDAKQATISDGDLTIAKTSGLQAALDAKQATIADGDLTIAKTNGLQAALDAKQATIADGDLTIAKTSGLQAALDAKQITITENTDVSLNNLKLHGDLSANDASFNVVDISSINTSSTSFMNSIIPNANDTYSLGDISNVWKDIYIGPGSLYIDGQKVIESDSSTIVVAADPNQNMKINTTGSGVLQLESAQGLEITSTGSGNITIGSTSTGTVRITDNIILASGVEIQNETDTTVKINDGLNVTGAYLQNGTNINTIYAPLSSPTLTGTPLAPTASSGTNTTQIATTAFVTTAVDNLIGGAPGALDTLNELAQALDNSGSFASNITTKVGSIETQLATKQDTIYTNDLSLGDISGLYTQLATIPTNNNQLTNGEGFITASSTDTLTNKTMSYSQLTGTPTIPTNNNQLTNGEGFITASSTDTFTNKTMSYSQLTGTPTIPTNNNQLTNGSSYITASSTDTFTNKTMSYSQLTGTPTIPTNNNQLTNGASYITASSTDTLTNKSISYSQLTGAPTIPTNNNQLTNGSSYITASSTDTLTNKSMSYSQLTGTPTIPTNNNQLTNGSGYITASSTNTLTNKTMSISQITNLQTEIDSKQATLTAGTNITITGSTISASGSGGGSSVWSGSSDIYYTGGNVGIGTTTSYAKLICQGTSEPTTGTGYTNTPANMAWPIVVNNVSAATRYNTGYGCGIKFKQYYDNINDQRWSGIAGVSQGQYTNYTGLAFYTCNYYVVTEKMRILHNGNVGIGTTTPDCALEVDRTSTVSIPSGRAYWFNGEQGHSAYSRALAIHAHGAVWSDNSTGFIATSDRRIKKNIVDVPDNLALEMVRNIPCRYYEYKDNLYSGTDKTIGFIAQEVAEVLPMAISIQTSIIPNELRKLENVSWEQIENTYKLITDLQDDVSGVKYRFYVSNDVSGNDEERKEIIGNSDNSFTFDSSYNNVFIYGKEVNDFHTLDKQKLFALNFSATQEIDRIQQQHIIDISNAQATIQQHETTIQQHETTIQQQQLEIENLKLVNQDMNNQINMIKEHLGL